MGQNRIGTGFPTRVVLLVFAAYLVGSTSPFAATCHAGERWFIGGVSVGESLLVGNGVSGVETVGLRGGVSLGDEFSAYLTLGEFGYVSRYWGKQPSGIERRRRGLSVGAGLESIQGDHVQLRLDAGIERIEQYGEDDHGFGPSNWAVPIRGSFRLQIVRSPFVPGVETVLGLHLGQSSALLPWYEFQLALAWRFLHAFSD